MDQQGHQTGATPPRQPAGHASAKVNGKTRMFQDLKAGDVCIIASQVPLMTRPTPLYTESRQQLVRVEEMRT